MREGEDGRQGLRKTKDPALGLLCPEKPQHKLEWMFPCSECLLARASLPGQGGDCWRRCWWLRAPAGKSQRALGGWGHRIKGGSETANGGDRGKGEKGVAKAPLSPLPFCLR